MTNYLTSSQLETLRTRPHNTKLWLSIYQPKVMLAGQATNGVGGVLTRNSRVITVFNITEGSFANIQCGMTMYVGTAPGLADKGRIRVKYFSVANSTITIAENSAIQFAENDYLTVVGFYEINAMFPRIVSDSSGTMTWYKDYDIGYFSSGTVQTIETSDPSYVIVTSDPNRYFGSFINMGSHYAGFIEDDGDCDIYYTATGTYDIYAYGRPVGTTYHWIFEGGNPATSTDFTPGFVKYNTPGHYTTTLTVSGSVTSDVSYRHISIYNRPEKGTNVPILNWALESLSGAKDSGGYSAKVKILQSVPETIIRDGALVVIFADDWYGYQKVSLGGNQPNRESIVFVGYIQDGSIYYNYRDKYIEFTIVSPTQIMQDAEGFAVSITDCPMDMPDPLTLFLSDPGTYVSPWAFVQFLDLRRAIYHYFKWHSTVMLCCDVSFNAADHFLTGVDFDRSSLYDAVNTLLSSAIIGRLVSDRQGKLWMEREPFADPYFYSFNPLVINKQDWMETPNIEEQSTEQISYLEIGGVAYACVSGSAVPLLAAAPGTTPGYRGSVERIQGLALYNQDELNWIGGMLYNYRNVRYPNITIPLAGNYRSIDIAPQSKYVIDIPASDTVRNKRIQNSSFVKSVSFIYDPEQETFLTNPVFGQLPTKLYADTLVEETPWQTETGSYGGNPTGTPIPTGTVPPIIIPPTPPPPVIPPVIPPPVVPPGEGGTIDWVGAPTTAVDVLGSGTSIYPNLLYNETCKCTTTIVCPVDGTLDLYAILAPGTHNNDPGHMNVWFYIYHGSQGGSDTKVISFEDGVDFLADDEVVYFLIGSQTCLAGDYLTCWTQAYRKQDDTFTYTVPFRAFAGHYTAYV